MIQDANSNSRQSRNFILLLIIIFFTTFASSMVSASPIPFLLKNLAATEEAFAFSIGLMASISSLAMITANFTGGFLADRIGRKTTISLGAGMLAPSLFAYTIAPGAFWVIALYFVQIFSISLFQPAFTALVADMSRVSSRGKAFGWFNLFWIGSAIPGPFIGGLLVDNLGLHFPFITGALVSLVGLVACFGLAGIPGMTTSAEQVVSQVENEKSLMPFGRVILIFGMVGMLSGLAGGLIIPLTKLYPIYVLKVTATELGLIISLGSALVTALVQIPGGRLTDSFGRKKIMLFSQLGAPFVVALAFTRSIFEFTLVYAGMNGLGNISGPAYSAWQMELVPCSKRAMTSGLINALTGIGMFFGPFLSIWLYQSQPTAILAFVVAAIPWILSVPPILKLKETKSSTT
ncbi:MAG TPA: MFS transporter [Candidatus Eisenbacteria bacterium]|nr:MFS transporter [Candidatus Eisenbacteria bacterium]